MPVALEASCSWDVCRVVDSMRPPRPTPCLDSSSAGVGCGGRWILGSHMEIRLCRRLRSSPSVHCLHLWEEGRVQGSSSAGGSWRGRDIRVERGLGWGRPEPLPPALAVGLL